MSLDHSGLDEFPPLPGCSPLGPGELHGPPSCSEASLRQQGPQRSATCTFRSCQGRRACGQNGSVCRVRETGNVLCWEGGNPLPSPAQGSGRWEGVKKVLWGQTVPREPTHVSTAEKRGSADCFSGRTSPPSDIRTEAQYTT